MSQEHHYPPVYIGLCGLSVLLFLIKSIDTWHLIRRFSAPFVLPMDYSDAYTQSRYWGFLLILGLLLVQAGLLFTQRSKQASTFSLVAILANFLVIALYALDFFVVFEIFF